MKWDIVNIKLILKKRKAFNKLRKVKDKEIFKLMSYKLFPTKRNNKFIWKIVDNLTIIYLKIVRIKTREMIKV